ncbi:MAG: UDP-N-acetylmuramate--L-alanine ligase [Patescibacteria group bacterium]
MKKRNHPHKKTVHFIGIGGIGVSALARYFLSKNYKVSGSDASRSEITDQFKKEGVDILIGHKPSNISKSASRRIDSIIHSAAVKKDNPEIKKAEEFGIPLKSYAQALGELTRQYKTIAVSGAHGKSTTTAMLSLVLIKAGFDPTVIIGTKLKEFGGKNFRSGKSKLLVIEADEYSGAFLNYSPFSAIITNIDREHLDYYKNLAEIKNVFLKFIGNIQHDGILILNKDDKNLYSLRDKIKKIAKKNKLKVYWHSIFPRQSALSLRMSASLNVPGEHNISNATAVYFLSKSLGIKENIILKALSEYRGAWRRMEYRGNLKLRIKKSIIHNSKFIIPIYDDYAHHPTEIKATLAGIRSKWPKSAIICVFQPHQEKRLKSLFKEFTGAFDDADALILLDIFKVKGREETKQSVDSLKLAEAIKKRKFPVNVLYLKNPKNLKKEIKNIILNSKSHILNSSIIIIMMGAGDIYHHTKRLLVQK